MTPHVTGPAPACETFRKRRTTALAAAVAIVVVVAVGGRVSALGASSPPSATAPAVRAPAPGSETGQAAPASEAGTAADEQPEAPPPGGHDAPAQAAPAAQDAHGAPGEDGAAAGHGGEEHAESPWALVARILNFALLAGGLFYVARGPLTRYLSSRSQQIRGDLVSARETTERASTHIAEIERKLAALPAELDALRAQGAEEIAAEEARIREQADAERQRLLEQTRRDLDLQVRLARRELAAHAADLAVALARDRAARSIEDADQVRLADRYVSQVKNIHG